MMTVQRTFRDLDSAQRAVVRLRAVGVPLTEIFLAGPDEDEFHAISQRSAEPVEPGSYLVAAHVSTSEDAELLGKVLDNESLTQLEFDRLRTLVQPLEPWHPVEVEFTPYGVQPEHHPPVDEGGPLEGETEA